MSPLTNRVPNEKDKKVLRFVGRINANIILTLSRPIRVSESDFLKILSFPKLHKAGKNEE